jgi:hypothetical protein
MYFPPSVIDLASKFGEPWVSPTIAFTLLSVPAKQRAVPQAEDKVYGNKTADRRSSGSDNFVASGRRKSCPWQLSHFGFIPERSLKSGRLNVPAVPRDTRAITTTWRRR